VRLAFFCIVMCGFTFLYSKLLRRRDLLPARIHTSMTYVPTRPHVTALNSLVDPSVGDENSLIIYIVAIHGFL
jgi:hypothetical protein